MTWENPENLFFFLERLLFLSSPTTFVNAFCPELISKRHLLGSHFWDKLCLEGHICRSLWNEAAACVLVQWVESSSPPSGTASELRVRKHFSFFLTVNAHKLLLSSVNFGSNDGTSAWASGLTLLSPSTASLLPSLASSVSRVQNAADVNRRTRMILSFISSQGFCLLWRF